ncbi:MAG: winged helix DNA-binding domain-containing protein [Candidatus Rokubacteria bacterium]|nr:winged helix DNA-binding domain-containing protein [Candidatus Rokubacteria bacterium]
MGLTWRLKDELPAAKQCYYGKILRGRPCLVALDLFPAFYALVRAAQRARDYRIEFRDGRLTLTARRIMDALTAEHPQYTRGLRASCFMLEARQTREFERAMGELQQGLWIVKTEERYEPSFSYRWDLLEAWLPEEVAAGRRMSRAAAAAALVERHARAAIYTRPGALRRLFPLSEAETAAAVTTLTTRGLLEETAVAGWPGRWLVHAAARRTR